MKDYTPELKAAIADRSAVVVYGTGVSRATSGGASSADWVGLIRHGIQFAQSMGATPEWAQTTDQLLHDALAQSELDMLINAATLVQKKIQSQGTQTYADWLHESVGDLQPVHRALANALGGLGVPLLTTNYDTLVERVLNRSSATWLEQETMRKIMRNEEQSIGHVHGVWDVPSTVTLSVSDYANILANTTTQFLQRAHYSTKSFVFVGYGDGLDDPNFGNMLELHHQLFPESQQHHFRLCQTKDVDRLNQQHRDSDIRIVSYGTEYDDLPAFLNSLRPTSIAAKTQDSVAFASEAILDQIRSETVVSDHFINVDERELNEITVAPVLLPLPHEQFAAARNNGGNARPEREDPHQVAKKGKIVIVAGEELSGVSTALRWLVSFAAQSRVRCAPLYIDARSCTSNQYALNKQVRREALDRRLTNKRSDPLPSHVLAVDNLRPSESAVYESILDDLRRSDAAAIYLGVRLGEEVAIAESLQNARLDVETVYVGKLGRIEVQALAEILVPDHPSRLVSDVLNVVRREHLPRTPFTVCLLLVLFSRGSHSSLQNSETAVLDKYVQLLLGRNGSFLDPRWTLDPQNREVALAHLAKGMIRQRQGALKLGAAIDSIDDYFKSVDWPEEALETLQSFAAMRILRMHNGTVQFQQSSYLHLFAAKAAITDGGFLAELLADPLFFSPIIRHYAALVRESEVVSTRMLALIKDEWPIEAPKSRAYQPVDERPMPAVPVGETEDKPLPPPPAPPEEDDYDLGDDTDLVPFPLDDPSTWSATQKLMGSLELASKVVRDSDTLANLELKSDLFISVLERWGFLLDQLVVEETFSETVDRMIDELTAIENWNEKEAAKQSDLFTLTLPAFVVFSSISSNLTSRKLSRAYDRAIDSERLGQSVFASSMAALFAFDVGAPGWAQSFARLLESHGPLWITADFLYILARLALMYQSLAPADVETLITFVKEHGLRTIAFPNDKEKKAWLARAEQKLRKQRSLNSREQVEGGSRVFEVIEAADDEEDG